MDTFRSKAAEEDSANFEKPSKERLGLFHDAELNSVQITQRRRRINLSFWCIESGLAEGDFRFIPRSLLFEGVLLARIESVTMQNVVSRLLLSNVSEISGEEFAQIVSWMSDSPDNGISGGHNVLPSRLEDIAAGRLYLFYLDPSWGAEIGIIAQRVSVDSQ